MIQNAAPASEIQSIESVDTAYHRSNVAQLNKFDGGFSDVEMQKFMKFYMQMENEKRSYESCGSGGAPQYQNLSNVNIFNISNSTHVGNLLSDPMHESSSLLAQGLKVFSSASKDVNT